jgi:hypothetical protein
MRKLTFRYSKTSGPSAAEVRKALRDAVRQVNAQESIQALVQQLTRLEAKYGMSTVEFYAKFLAGEMGDSFEVIEWAGDYEQYTRVMEAYRQKAIHQSETQ